MDVPLLYFHQENRMDFKDIPEHLKTVSPSRIGTFNSCRRKFKYLYVDQLKAIRIPQWFGFGKAMDVGLEHYMRGIKEFRKPTDVINNARYEFCKVAYDLDDSKCDWDG